MKMAQQAKTELFRAPVMALEAARDALRSGSGDAAESIKRIAGRIADVARSAGLPRAAQAATILRDAAVDDVKDVVDAVLDIVRAEVEQGGDECHTVLIIEDDKLSARIMSEVLQASDRAILVAGNAREAYEILATQSVSVILLDLVLPDADGRDILVNLRKNERTAWLPVIVLTAKDDALTQSECYALGADGFLIKPVDWEVLRSTVWGTLQRARQMQREAQVDPLTMLPNRAAFWDAFERSLAQRGNAPLSIAILDLDRFKSINDTYGHATGDEVLRIVARVVSNALRGSDFISRWGGEEFCIFLPDTSLENATRVLTRALQRLRQTSITAPDGTSFGVTFSAGLATVSAGVGGGDALAQADRLLYVAKKSGRNRVCSPEDAQPPRPRIMLADDDVAVCNVVAKMLNDEGFEVDKFSDGASALAAASRGDFSMAVVDVTMPVMDGFELVGHLRALPQFTQLPIVMLTGAGTEADIVRGFELGVSDYIVKPFNRAEFVARIWRLVKRP
jgi:diguanylate cyclase (GGDEF)-like protein